MPCITLTEHMGASRFAGPRTLFTLESLAENPNLGRRRVEPRFDPGEARLASAISVGTRRIALAKRSGRRSLLAPQQKKVKSANRSMSVPSGANAASPVSYGLFANGGRANSIGLRPRRNSWASLRRYAGADLQILLR
jgi:hypothetical protein